MKLTLTRDDLSRFTAQLRGTVERIEFAMAGRPLTIGE